jgi:hypothetical protein
LYEKFTKFYDAYDTGAIPKNNEMTPLWDEACKICLGKPEAKTKDDCCTTMVKAEQGELENCKAKCGEYPGDAKLLPLKKFEGDFNMLEDRIKFGLKRCCTTPKENK